MRVIRLAVVALIVAAAPPQVFGPTPTYADLAALTLASPVVARATIVRSDRIGVKDAPDLPPGRTRLLVRAALSAAIKAPGGVPAQIEYLFDAPLDARGKPPRLKGAAVLVFLRASTSPGQYALVSAPAQIAATPATEATIRAVLADAKRDVPVITGVGNAFRVPGAVPGEAESQFFLTTATSPVSLVVLTRPGQPRTLSLALGEIVDDAAAPIRPDTLLWYRLACFLPRALPAGVGGDDRAALGDDYAFVLASLGPCARNL